MLLCLHFCKIELFEYTNINREEVLEKQHHGQYIDIKKQEHLNVISTTTIFKDVVEDCSDCNQQNRRQSTMRGNRDKFMRR